MTNPRISVVMPVYNVEDYVGAAIESVLSQSFTDFELIIVDDGGTDDSIAICRGFTDPRICIISQANRGLAGARNTGIAAARGDYVALLDSDDRWHASKLMMHFIHLEADASVDVSYSGSQFIDHRGVHLKTAMRPRLTGITPEHILMRNPVGNGSAAVLRRSSLNRVAIAHPEDRSRLCWFDESFRQSEDIELWLRMAAAHALRFEGIAGLLTEYRISAGGLSANIARQFESWSRVVDKAEGYAPKLLARHRRAATAFQLRYLARRAVQMGDGSFAWSLAVEAITTCPALFIKEPRKTAVTLAAAFAARVLPPRHFQALTGVYTGAGVQS